MTSWRFSSQYRWARLSPNFTNHAPPDTGLSLSHCSSFTIGQDPAMGCIELSNIPQRHSRGESTKLVGFKKTLAFNRFEADSRFINVHLRFLSMNHTFGSIKVNVSLYIKLSQRNDWSYMNHVLRDYNPFEATRNGIVTLKLPLEYGPDSWELGQPEKAWFDLPRGCSQAFFEIKLIFSLHFGSKRCYTFSAFSPLLSLVLEQPPALLSDCDDELFISQPSCLSHPDQPPCKRARRLIETPNFEPLHEKFNEDSSKSPLPEEVAHDYEALTIPVKVIDTPIPMATITQQHTGVGHDEQVQQLREALIAKEVLIEHLRKELKQYRATSCVALESSSAGQVTLSTSHADDDKPESIDSTLADVSSASQASSKSSSSSQYMLNSAAIRAILPPYLVCRVNPFHLLHLSVDPSFVLRFNNSEMESQVWRAYRLRKSSLNNRGYTSSSIDGESLQEVQEARRWMLTDCIPFLQRLRELAFATYSSCGGAENPTVDNIQRENLILDGLMKLRCQIEDYSSMYH